MTASRPLAPPPRRRSPFLLRGLRSLAVGGVLAVLFALVFDRDLVRSLVYVLSITLGCWFFIDTGRLAAARVMNRLVPGRAGGADWPGWPVMAGVLIAGTVLGYVAGTALGNLLIVSEARDLLPGGARQALGALMISLIPGVAATFFFWSRGRLAASEARAQQAQREAAENQLRLLESQLEPHMLFNTLANLRVLIGLDPPRAQAMLDQLIAFLRATLNASRVGRHALSAEFSRLADYLALMQVRMGARLQMRLDLPDELASRALPPLLLQPLVENAIKHGLEPKVEGGRIEVRAARERDRLVLTVRDTGVGLAAPAGDGTQFGLLQVRERLATLYGDAASLTLADAADAEGGVLATVHLPLDP
jgi:signal transduction histidine kinase